MELWERSAELDQLDDLLRQSARGGRIAVVAGEAGIGKSALVTEFTQRRNTAARVLWGACDRLVTPRAMGPIHDIGRQTGGALADQLSAGAGPEDIFTAFLDELSGPVQRQRPVVVLEDVHWADEATLDLLVLLGRRIGRMSAVLIMTYRDDEVAADHPLRGALASLPSGIVRRIALPPLSAECVSEQAELAGQDAETVLGLAGGNPLLVTELLKSSGQRVPATVQDLILDRLRALPESARDLAHLVSVIPTRADADLVTDDPLDACVDAGVLIRSGHGASYRHELLRSAVEDSLSPARRTALHRRVLSLLAGSDDVDPGRLVHHARHAADDEAVLRYGRIAGADAARQGSHREAAAHYGAAAAHADQLPADEAAALFESYGFEAYLAGHFEDGLQARQSALPIRESLNQPERVGENLRWISRLSWTTRRRAQAREAAARAIAVLETEPPGRQLAMAYSNQSQIHLVAYELDDAAEWGRRAMSLADQLGDAETAIHAAVNVNTARLALGDPDAVAAMEAIHYRAAELGLGDHAGRALVNLTGVLSDELGDYATAARLIDRTLDYTTSHGLEGYAGFAVSTRARIRFKRLDWPGALADAGAAMARPPASGTAMVPPLLVVGRISAARGESDALSVLDEALAVAERADELQALSPVSVARSEYFWLIGDAERAAAEARRGLERAQSVSDRFHVEELAFQLWRAGGTVDISIDGTHPYLMMIRGDWSGAAAEWERRGSSYARLEALSGGDESATSEVLRTLDDLGASRAANRLRAELKKRGYTRVPRGPRPSTAANAAGLTARQVEVLALLVDGLSNADIAGRLSLSPKTVDHHISAVLSKLGVTNRGQAAALARQMDLT